MEGKELKVSKRKEGYKATAPKDSLNITIKEAFLFLRAFRILLDQTPGQLSERNGKIGKVVLILPKMLVSQEGR